VKYCGQMESSVVAFVKQKVIGNVLLAMVIGHAVMDADPLVEIRGR
jgi:hypothetical protein